MDKLKANYENSTPVNQVYLMRKLVNLQLDESKPTSVLNEEIRRKVSGETGGAQ